MPCVYNVCARLSVCLPSCSSPSPGLLKGWIVSHISVDISLSELSCFLKGVPFPEEGMPPGDRSRFDVISSFRHRVVFISSLLIEKSVRQLSLTTYSYKMGCLI